MFSVISELINRKWNADTLKVLMPSVKKCNVEESKTNQVVKGSIMWAIGIVLVQLWVYLRVWGISFSTLKGLFGNKYMIESLLDMMPSMIGAMISGIILPAIVFVYFKYFKNKFETVIIYQALSVFGAYIALKSCVSVFTILKAMINNIGLSLILIAGEVLVVLGTLHIANSSLKICEDLYVPEENQQIKETKIEIEPQTSSKKFCSSCGAENSTNGKFCQSCGNSIN